MALNKTFSGFVYLDDGSPGQDQVKYQALFYPNGTASSPTKWNAVRITENTSYWNFNLGDADFLGQEGVALPDAKVVIVFWVGDTLDRNSLCTGPERLVQWGATEVTLTTADVYTLDTQVKVNIEPILVWSIDNNGLVGSNYTVVNNSYDVHSWFYNGTEMHHYRTRYGENIQLINTIVEARFDWGDGTPEEVFSGVSGASHSWDSSGDYTVRITVVDECGGITTGTSVIEVKYNAPIPNIICHQANSNNDITIPNTPVTFQYSGTDVDNRIISIDWVIRDSGVYGNTDTNFPAAGKNDVIQHSMGSGSAWCGETQNVGAFTNPGDHTVEISILWNDGFNDLTINYTEVFTQLKFNGPTIYFTQDPPHGVINNQISFINNSANTDRIGTGLPNCLEYDWYLKENNVIVDELINKDYAYVYTVSPTTINAYIGLRGHWNDGWENHITTYETNIIFETTVTVTPEDCYYIIDIIGTSQDGTISGYSWEIYKDTTVSGIGPWELIWESPVGIDQKTKKIGFTEEGYFKVVGYIYGGGTTSDDEIIHVEEVCLSATEEIIWDGTGPLDEVTIWSRLGFGNESIKAHKKGTYGLDLNGLNTNNLSFVRPTALDITNYESVSFYIKILKATKTSDIEISFVNSTNSNEASVKLSNYIKLERDYGWQHVIINTEDFTTAYQVFDTLVFRGIGIISCYIDYVRFSKLYVKYKYIRVCDPDISGESAGDKIVTARPVTPIILTEEVKPLAPGLIGRSDTPVINNPKYPKPKLS